MTWSLRTHTKPANEIRAEIEAMALNPEEEGITPEDLAQLEQAKTAAIAVIDSGAVGEVDPESDKGLFTVSTTGTSDPKETRNITIAVNNTPEEE